MSFRLHAHWLPQQGIGLWVEQNGRIADYESPQVQDFLAKLHIVPQPARNVGAVRVPEILLEEKRADDAEENTVDGKSRLREQRIPMQLLSNSQAVALFKKFIDEAPSEKNIHGGALSGEILWLMRLIQGIEKIISAGKVTFRPYKLGDYWGMRWIPLPSPDVQYFLQTMEPVLPPVFQKNIDSPVAFTEIVQVLTDTLVRKALTQAGEQGELEAPHFPLTVALTDEDSDTGAVAHPGKFGDLLYQWRATAPVSDQEIVFVFTDNDGEEQEEDSAPTLRLVENKTWWVSVDVGSSENIVTDAVDVYEVTDAHRDLIARTWSKAIKAWPTLGELGRNLTVWLGNGFWVPDNRTVHREDIGPKDLGFFIDEDAMVEFLDMGMELLETQGIRVNVPKGWLDRKSVNASLNVSSGSGVTGIGLGGLNQFSWDIAVGDVHLTEDEVAELLRTSSGIVELKNKVVRLNTTDLQNLRRNLQLVEELSEEHAGEGGEKLPAQISTGSLMRLQQEMLGESIQNKESELNSLTIDAQGWVSGLLGADASGIAAPTHVHTPAGLNGTLYEHQRVGLDWLVWLIQHRLGGILADDMGVGKTIQTIALLLWMREHDQLEHPAMIIAPKSVLKTWKDQLEQFAPGLRVHIDHGSSALAPEKFVDTLSELDIVLTTYGTVHTQEEKYSQSHYSIIVADEAQMIKNKDTKAAQSIRALRTTQRLALTGTPVENSLRDLFSHMDFVNPGLMGDYAAFSNRIAIPIERNGDECALDRLQQIIAPFILRRVKTDEEVGLDLPEKEEIKIETYLTAEQAALYQKCLDKLEEDIARHPRQAGQFIRVAMGQLQMISTHPVYYTNDAKGTVLDGQHRSGKIQAFIELVQGLLEQDKKILVFTRFPGKIKSIMPFLEKYFGMSIPILDGALSRTQRDTFVKDFQAGKHSLAVLGVKSGGTGITLTEATEVIHLDRWFNPAVEDQATDRAYRIGQTKDVTVYKFVTKGTIEEQLDLLLARKRELAQAVVSSSETVLRDLSPEEFMELAALQHSATLRLKNEDQHAQILETGEAGY